VDEQTMFIIQARLMNKTSKNICFRSSYLKKIITNIFLLN